MFFLKIFFFILLFYGYIYLIVQCDVPKLESCKNKIHQYVTHYIGVGVYPQVVVLL